MIIALLAVVVLAAGYFVLRNVTSKEDAAKQDTAVINKNKADLDSVTIAVAGEKPFTIEASGQTPNRVFTIADYAPDLSSGKLQWTPFFRRYPKLFRKKQSMKIRRICPYTG